RQDQPEVRAEARRRRPVGRALERRHRRVDRERGGMRTGLRPRAPAPSGKKSSSLPKAAKINLLDHFYDHLDEGDWLDGVDLYQAGRVINLSTYEGLITARVSPQSSGGAEVRLKIHPAG